MRDSSASNKYTVVQHCFPVYGGGLEVHGVDGILQVLTLYVLYLLYWGAQCCFVCVLIFVWNYWIVILVQQIFYSFLQSDFYNVTYWCDYIFRPTRTAWVTWCFPAPHCSVPLSRPRMRLWAKKSSRKFRLKIVCFVYTCFALVVACVNCTFCLHVESYLRTKFLSLLAHSYSFLPCIFSVVLLPYPPFPLW